MNINELVTKIHKSNANQIRVERLAVMKGNKDGIGNHRLLQLTLGEGEDQVKIQFSDENGEWVAK